MNTAYRQKCIHISLRGFIRKAIFVCFIGPSLALSQIAFSVSQGPSGGLGGDIFWDTANSDESIALLQVRSGSAIDAIRLGYRNNTTGAFRLGPRHGGSGGGEENIFFRPGEEVSYISGYYGMYNNILVIRKLCISTTQGRYFNFGVASGRYFYYGNPRVANVKFSGIKGASGSLLDALGAIWNPR